MTTVSKRQMVLEICAERKLQSAGRAEVQAIQAELRRRRGQEDKTSASYIARVLQQAGFRVEYEHPFVSLSLPEPYASRLAGLLRFDNLANAEDSLRKLEEARLDYQGDRAGTLYVRSLVLKGKQRAERLAADLRISVEKRCEKREIANWFRVWLQTPDIFRDWLEIRKGAEDFRRHFGDRSKSSRQ